MKKTMLLLSVVFLLLPFLVKAQHKASDQMDSFNWGIISMVKFRQVSPTEIYPVYDETVMRFDNRAFELEGYMIPLKGGRKQNRFLLSNLPINQCAFCGKNGNPIMVLINLDRPVDFTFKTVKVKGTLKLDNKNMAVDMPVSLENASLDL
ncbi:hypothetical protein [Mucilaginibacter sp.]|uniref:hypothetical protein n=1 Tax=Mucilaginibacter sp. TaxID=1882438 RepID=UPI003AFFE62E